MTLGHWHVEPGTEAAEWYIEPGTEMARWYVEPGTEVPPMAHAAGGTRDWYADLAGRAT